MLKEIGQIRFWARFPGTVKPPAAQAVAAAELGKAAEAPDGLYAIENQMTGWRPIWPES